jgi:hypothetical protein
LKQERTKSEDNIQATRLAYLIALAPRATEAQREMDIHHGGYRNHKARLYELIEFNDTFVTVVLALSEAELSSFVLQFRVAIDMMCRRANVEPFSDEQFLAIVHGLSREIAVYRGAIKEGFEAKMTSRSEDAHGVDMVIRDPERKISMNIDCKTHSSYHFRLLDLQRDRLITEEERMDAELRGFIVLRHGKHSDFVRTTLVQIATEYLGEIRDFSFVDTKKLGVLLHRAIDAQ